jgi:hypothetical protein
MSKTDKVEITEDMHLAEQCWWERHNKRVDMLESIECFSEYTPSMELGNSSTLVMLELPTDVVENARLVSKVVNAKYKQMGGEDEYGLTPFDVLASAYEKTDINHYPEYVVEEEMEEMEGIHKLLNHSNQ